MDGDSEKNVMQSSSISSPAETAQADASAQEQDKSTQNSTTQNASYPVQDSITSQSSSRNASSDTNSTNVTSQASGKSNASQATSHKSQQSTKSMDSSTTTTESPEDAAGWGTSWGSASLWSGLTSIAKEVSTAVVDGVKEELLEIREDIETVASASVVASQKLAEVSTTVAGKAVEQSKAAADASKEFLQNDLQEFGRVLGEETHESIKDAKEVGVVVGSTLGGWMSTLSHAVASSALITGTGDYYDDNNEQGIIIGKNKQKVNFVTAYEARIHSLRTDTSTYCTEPSDNADYELWRETFDIDAQTTKKTISDLLVNSQEVRSLYTKLVPSAVAHQEFWQRYFYKLDALERAERKRTALMERADRSGTEEEEDLSWGDDESDSEEKKESSTAVKVELTAESLAKMSVTGGPNVISSASSDSPVLVPGNKDSSVASTSTTPAGVNSTAAKSAAQQQLESDDWEKEFELDMTEKEIAEALQKDGGVEEDLDGWE